MRSRIDKGRLAFIAVGVLVVALAAPVGADPNVPFGTFSDDNGNTHEGFIEAIAAEGITAGCNPPANDRYCPNQAVSRQQMASFLVRAIGLPATTEDYFGDDGSSIHEANINALAAAGITAGCNPPDNDEFCPTATVTRGQMAAFLVRAFGYTDSDPGDTFTDDDGLIFEDDIEALATAGVTKGCNPPANDKYCPTAPVQRSQMATFLGRALALTPTTPPTVATANVAGIYFMYDQPADGPYVAPIARYLAAPATPEDAVDLLLTGLTPVEEAQIPPFSSEVPAGTTRNGPIDVAAGVATVDVSGNFDDGGGSATMFARLGQLTFTLAAFPTIDTVMLELDGVPVTTFSSEGIDIAAGMDRDYFLGTGVVSENLVDSPASWQYVSSLIQVTGIARAFEATVDWALYDRDGTQLISGFVTASIGAPDWGGFSISIPYAVDELQVGTLQVWETSAKDGSRTFLRETTLWLTP
jgi:spore germination protein GerM